MKNNPNQDIEQLLREYAEDQRQQKAAVERVHAMARRQRRIGGVAAAVVLLALFAVPVTGILSPSVHDRLGSPLVAETEPHCQPSALPAAPSVTSLPLDVDRFNDPHHINRSTLQRTNTSRDRQFHETAMATVPPQFASVQPLANPPIDVDQFDAGVFNDPHHIVVSTDKGTDASGDKQFRETAVIHADSVCIDPLPVVDEPETRNPASHGYLHLTAQVGGTVSPSYYQRTCLSAGVCLGVAVASAPLYEMGIGIGVDGYIRTRSLLFATKEGLSSFVESNHADNIDGFHWADNFDEIPGWVYPTFALYATLPFTLNLYPRGPDKSGLLFSFAPGRSLTPVTGTVGDVKLKGINPWKLTFGVGISFPKSIFRNITLTANLLPSYIEGPLKNVHEVGMSVGF